MYTFKKSVAFLSAALITISSLTGCSSADKASVKETSENFLSVVASKSQEDITKYATSEVANGDFVKLFDADMLLQQFSEGFSDAELTDETNAKVEEFCHIYAEMIHEYTVTKVEVGKDNTASSIVTLSTDFPIDIINNETVSNKITEAVSNYNNDNSEELIALYQEGTQQAESKIYNDIIMIILDIYEQEIADSEPMSYAIVLNLEKNTETDEWLVTGVQDYDSSTSSTDSSK